MSIEITFPQIPGTVEYRIYRDWRPGVSPASPLAFIVQPELAATTALEVRGAPATQMDAQYCTFRLMHKAIDPTRPVTVLVNGQPSNDYTVEFDDGILTFNRPLVPGSRVICYYWYRGYRVRDDGSEQPGVISFLDEPVDTSAPGKPTETRSHLDSATLLYTLSWRPPSDFASNWFYRVYSVRPNGLEMPVTEELKFPALSKVDYYEIQLSYDGGEYQVAGITTQLTYAITDVPPPPPVNNEVGFPYQGYNLVAWQNPRETYQIIRARVCAVDGAGHRGPYAYFDEIHVKPAIKGILVKARRASGPSDEVYPTLNDASLEVLRSDTLVARAIHYGPESSSTYNYSIWTFDGLDNYSVAVTVQITSLDAIPPEPTQYITITEVIV